MKYVRLNEKREVEEIFPYNPFEWIANKEFLSMCRKVDGLAEVGFGWTEQPDGSFAPPVSDLPSEPLTAPASFGIEPAMFVTANAPASEAGKISLLNMRVNNQSLYMDSGSDGKPVVVADSINYLYIQFSFTPEWDGAKFALFYDSTNASPTEVELNNGVPPEGYLCLVPYEVIKAPYFSVSVYCVTADGRRITTGKLRVTVNRSGYLGESEPPDPVPGQTVSVFTPVESPVKQIRVVDGELEYTSDGEIWNKSSSGISVGEVTARTTDSGNPAKVIIEAEDNKLSFDFEIPEGNTGATGTAATVEVGTVTTGAPGTNASVTNVGTPSAAKFNFVLPRGRDGAADAQNIREPIVSETIPDGQPEGSLWLDISDGLSETGEGGIMIANAVVSDTEIEDKDKLWFNT